MSPPPPNWVNVLVYNYPFDAPNAPITSALGIYGTIQTVCFQYWTNLPEFATGTRIVRMNLMGCIPCFVMIGRYRCKVWYRAQPIYCDICKESTHIAFNCPFKGKCLACKEIGHVACQCPTVCFQCKGGHASDACPNRRRWERPARDDDDDDFQSVASDVGANFVVDDVEPIAAPATQPANGDGTDPPDHPNVPAADPTPSASLSSQMPSTLSSPPIDAKFNQLDELQSQPDVADSASQSQSVLAGLTQAVHDACEVLVVSDVSAGPSPSSPVSAPGHDVCMAESSGARKRDAPETTSSHDVEDSPRGRSQTRSCKVPRCPTPHVPPGVASAASLAHSRSSSGSRSSLRK